MSQVDAKLYKEYKRLADRADKRLLRLERLAEKNPDMYGNVLAFAYKGAQKAVEHWDGKKSDKPRFARKTPRTEEEMRKKMKDIQAFLEKPTSSKKGIDQVYKNRSDSLNKRFGTDFTWQEWARFGARQLWERNDGKFTYNELIRVAAVQKKEEETIKAYNKFKKALRTGTGSVKPLKYRVNIKGDNLLQQIQDEITDGFNISGMLSEDLNLIQKSVNTIFEAKKNIVFKQTQQMLANNGLDYNTMFK